MRNGAHRTLKLPHLTSTQPNFNANQVLLSNVMTTIPFAEDPLIIIRKKEAKGLKPRQLFLIEIKMPKRIKKAGKCKQTEKKKMALKILLNTNSVNINLQTLTAKNRLDDCAGFLGI